MRSGPVWAWALVWLEIGLLLGAGAVHWLLSQPELMPPPASLAPAFQPVVEEGAVSGPVIAGRAVPGARVRLIWQVTNTGAAAWDPADYRFVPQQGEVELLALNRTVAPGATAVVAADLTVPNRLGHWVVAWHLAGPRGEVPGTVLSVEFVVTALP